MKGKDAFLNWLSGALGMSIADDKPLSMEQIKKINDSLQKVLEQDRKEEEQRKYDREQGRYM